MYYIVNTIYDICRYTNINSIIIILIKVLYYYNYTLYSM